MAAVPPPTVRTKQGRAILAGGDGAVHGGIGRGNPGRGCGWDADCDDVRKEGGNRTCAVRS